MPLPSSVTRIRPKPPPFATTSMRGGAGVDRVLDQLLDDARRALDHLARGDAVDEVRRQLAYGHRGPRGVSRAKIAARDDLTRFYRWLVERVDAQEMRRRGSFPA